MSGRARGAGKGAAAQCRRGSLLASRRYAVCEPAGLRAKRAPGADRPCLLQSHSRRADRRCQLIAALASEADKTDEAFMPSTSPRRPRKKKPPKEAVFRSAPKEPGIRTNDAHPRWHRSRFGSRPRPRRRTQSWRRSCSWCKRPCRKAPCASTGCTGIAPRTGRPCRCCRC